MKEHLIAFWNVENLFGPENHTHRIDWVKADTAKDLKGWSQSLYKRKLAQLVDIISEMKDGAGPEILGVCEVEDEHVLGDLITSLNAALPGRRYDMVYATSDLSSRGIDTAFVYDDALFSVNPAMVFNHFVMRRTGTRDILQATFRRRGNGKEVIVMANHWPSRYGGDGAEASAGFRATAGETLAYWHEKIMQVAPKGKRSPVIAFGDLNDDPWDRSVTINANATREVGDVRRATSAKFANLTWDYLRTPAKTHKGKDRVLEGTLYFENNGNLFDQILVNRPLLDGKTDSEFKYVEGSAGLFAPQRMVSHKTGLGPIRFGLPKGDVAKNVNKDGYSDHFPVVLTIREV